MFGGLSNGGLVQWGASVVVFAQPKPAGKASLYRAANTLTSSLEVPAPSVCCGVAWRPGCDFV